ncbi:MAG: phytanoyl-CoA dioxygenase family protein [Candidatus Latescibacterota bacterium]|nr:phytanoyl-CoA dioxygenase family protein [Candidatus Latescibacterota bacterium]
MSTPTAPSTPVADEEIQSYQRDGFVRLEEFFSGGEMDVLREAIDDAIASHRDRILGAEKGGRSSDDYERVFNQMVNLWVDCAAVKPFSLSSRLAEAGRLLTQCRHVRIYHDHALVKPGGQVSKETNWHQDAPYWPMDPLGSFSAWIAVDDVTVDNGCLHFVPRSHKFGKQPPIRLGVEGESIVQKMKEQGYDVAAPATMEMKAGGVTFHHGCNFHYAGPNATDQPRRAHAIIYIPDFVAFTGGGEAAGAGSEMKAGGPWDHPLHPIVAGKE